MVPSSKPNKPSKRILIFAIVVTALLVGSEVVFQLEKSTLVKLPDTGTTTSVYSTNVDLQLILRLSNATINVSQPEIMNIQVYNPTGIVKSVNLGSNYSIDNLMAFLPGMYLPIDFAVYSGNYSMNELKNIAHLNILPPSALPLGKVPTSFLFLPHSSKAKEFHGFEPDGYTIFNGSLSMEGYWIDNLTIFKPFSAGVYTVLAADGWDQAVTLHFTVKNA